ncbi:MAG: nucleoside triphosphate pyrophosphohydrolase [Clostridia bacterium]|nr:nucleoside triphosphate pyrophosphohydrolase [Clostridia bacterium]
MPFSPKDFQEQETYSFDDLLALVRFLRSPEGCEWDRAQTHASVRKNLLEEAYEVAEGIDRDDPKILREELGDHLFQAAFHIIMEEERGRFLPQEVLNDICRKMIARHPHLFAANREHVAAEAVPAKWEALKRAEKGQQTATDTLRALPKTLPALMYAQKMTEKAARAGFTYEGAEEAGEKVCEEWRELAAAKTQAEREEELGDLLFALANYARMIGVDSEEALARAARKFLDRFAGMEENFTQVGRKLADCTKKELIFSWYEQKNTEKSTKIAKI